MPPGQRQTPRADTHTPGQTHPPGRHSPMQCMLGYGQQADGTHPTEMHSCFIDSFTHLQNDGVFYRSAGGVRSGDPGLGDGDAGNDHAGPPGDAVQDLRAVQHGGARGLPANRTGQGHHLQVQFNGIKYFPGGSDPGRCARPKFCYSMQIRQCSLLTFCGGRVHRGEGR